MDKQWGREGRSARREQARALAKEFMQKAQSGNEDKLSRWDLALFCLAAVLGFLIFVIDKTPTTVGMCLFFMCVLLVHPVINLPWIRESGARKVTATLCAFGLVGVIGYGNWPKPATRHLSGGDEMTLQVELEKYKSTEVSISYVANDMEASELANQLYLVFDHALWNIKPRMVTTLISGGSPIVGIRISYTKEHDPLPDILKNAFKDVGLKAETEYLPIPGMQIAVEVGVDPNHHL